MVEPLYKVKVACAVCDINFETSKMRPSFKKGASTDSDFCIHYKDPAINPDFYVVRVCPQCGYSFTENFTTKIPEKNIKDFQEKISVNWKWLDYGGERSWDDALKVYKLALVSGQIMGQSERVIAGILHHIAWLYRYKNDVEQENRFLQFALDAYVKVYEFEGIELNNARLMYLLGELNRRLGNFNDAVQWFSKVVNDKKIVDAAMISSCRRQWEQTREDMRGLNPSDESSG